MRARGQNPNFPVSKEGLKQLDDASRAVNAHLGMGRDAMLQSERGQLEPFKTYYLNMLENNIIEKPFKIGPHKSILFRGIVSYSGDFEIPQSFTSNDYVYYWAGPNRPSDPRNWSKMQVGKTFEFELPYSEGWLWMPNIERNPTFAVFEISVLAKIRAYVIQEGSLGNVKITTGDLFEPNPPVAVDDSGAVEIVPIGVEGRTVTLQNQGPNAVWLGGTAGGTLEAVALSGTSLANGEKVQIRNASGISGICDTGETASVSFTVEE